VCFGFYQTPGMLEQIRAVQFERLGVKPYTIAAKRSEENGGILARQEDRLGSSQFRLPV